MTRLNGITLSVLRIVCGFLFVCAGGMKLLGWFGGMPAGIPMTPLILWAGIIELVGGALLMAGLATRPVAFLCSGEMAVAYFIGHAPGGFWPILNHGEPAVLLCFIYLHLAAAGGGPISVDHLIQQVRWLPAWRRAAAV